MASQKSRRKLANQVRKQRKLQKGPFVHPDGDRRHRAEFQQSVKDALAQKRLMQTMGVLPVEE